MGRFFLNFLRTDPSHNTGGGWATNKFIYEFPYKNMFCPMKRYRRTHHTAHKVQLPLHTMTACKDDRQDDTISMTAVVVIITPPAVSPHQTGSQVHRRGAKVAVVACTLLWCRGPLAPVPAVAQTNYTAYCPHIHSAITYLWTLQECEG